MQIVTRTTSDASGGAKTSSIVNLDLWIAPFNVSVSVRVTGTVSYTVQYTYDDVSAAGYVPASGNWVDLTALAAKTATLDGGLAYPVTAVRLVQASGSGSCVMTVIQAGSVGK